MKRFIAEPVYEGEPLAEVNYRGKCIKVERRDGAFHFTLDNGYQFSYSESNLDEEYERNQTAWGQFILEHLVSTGVVTFSEVLDDYVMTESLEYLERAYKEGILYDVEHVRQESRTDIFT